MKCVNKKKLGRMVMGNKKAQYNFLQSEMAILKKLVSTNDNLYVLGASKCIATL